MIQRFIAFLILSITCCSNNFASQYEILGIGAPIIDILLPVEEACLCHLNALKGGGTQVDWNCFENILKTANVENPQIATGGSCSNTIKGLASLQDNCAILGKIGEDDLGQIYLNNIKSIGVTPLFICSKTPTAQVAVLITPDFQRTFRCFPGAGNELVGDDLTPEMFEGVRHVHLEGYAFYNGDLVSRALKMAKEAGATVSIDLATCEVVGQFRDQMLDLIPKYVDIVFANEYEAKALTGLPPEEACDQIRQMCPISVVLIGKNGCWVGSNEGKTHCPGIPVTVKDTTGAGDLFASGFIHGFLQGRSYETCAYFGNLLGSTVVTVMGAEIPQDMWPAIQEKMHAAE